MLPMLGLATIVVLLGAILSKRMSPLVALIIVPIVASLIGGLPKQSDLRSRTGDEPRVSHLVAQRCTL